MSMTLFQATALYAGVNALLLLALAMRVVAMRIRHRVGLGDGDGANDELRRAVRAHANCAENAPMGLLLLALAEAQGAPLWVAHALGLMLTCGRIAHAWSILGGAPRGFRQLGMGLTWTMMAVSALGLVGHALFG